MTGGGAPAVQVPRSYCRKKARSGLTRHSTDRGSGTTVATPATPTLQTDREFCDRRAGPVASQESNEANTAHAAASGTYATRNRAEREHTPGDSQDHRATARLTFHVGNGGIGLARAPCICYVVSLTGP